MASQGLKSPDMLYSFRPKCGEILSLKYVVASGGDSIISGSSLGAIDIWCLKTKRSVCHLNLETPVIMMDSCFINQEHNLVSQSKGGSITLLDMTLCKLQSLKIDDPGFCKVATFDFRSKYGSGFCVPHSRSKINLHDLESNQLIGSFTDETYKNRGLCMCLKTLFDSKNSTSYIFGGFEDGSVLVWEERQPDKVFAVRQMFSDPVFCMAVDTTSRKGIVGSHDNTLKCFKFLLEQMICTIYQTSICCGGTLGKVYMKLLLSYVCPFYKEQGTLEDKYSVKLKNPGIADIAVRGDSKIVATGGWDGRIRVFGWSKGNPLAVINYHSACVNTVHFAPQPCQDSDSNVLMSGSKDGVISSWKLY